MRSVSSPRAVSMMIGVLDRARRARQTSKPEPSGNMTSRRTRSGSLSAARRSASAAVRATSVAKPSLSRAACSGSVIEASSSTIRTVRLPVAICSMLGRVGPPGHRSRRPLHPRAVCGSVVVAARTGARAVVVVVVVAVVAAAVAGAGAARVAGARPAVVVVEVVAACRLRSRRCGPRRCRGRSCRRGSRARGPRRCRDRSCPRGRLRDRRDRRRGLGHPRHARPRRCSADRWRARPRRRGRRCPRRHSADPSAPASGSRRPRSADRSRARPRHTGRRCRRAGCRRRYEGDHLDPGPRPQSWWCGPRRWSCRPRSSSSPRCSRTDPAPLRPPPPRPGCRTGRRPGSVSGLSSCCSLRSLQGR